MIPFRCGLAVLTSTAAFYFPNEAITAYVLIVFELILRLNLDRLGGGTFDFAIKTANQTIDVIHVLKV